MSDYKQRIVDEKNQLEERAFKLSTFIQGSAFKNLSVANQFLLRKQLEVMNSYLGILNCRIDLCD